MNEYPSCPVCGFVWRGPGRPPALHQQIEFPMLPGETREQAKQRLSGDAARIRERAPWCPGKISRCDPMRWRELAPDELPEPGDEVWNPDLQRWEAVAIPSMHLAGGQRIDGSRFRTLRNIPNNS